MNKALGGCLAAALLFVVLVGVAGYYLVWKPAAQVAGVALEAARETVGKVGELAETIEAMRALEQRVARQGPYTPPADGIIDAGQLERFLAVHAAVAAALGPEFARVGAETSAVTGSAPRPTDAASWREALGALARLGDVGIAAKKAQVAALDAAGLSLAEYAWIRDTGLAALVAGGVLAVAAEADAVASSADAATRAALEASRAALREAARAARAATGAAPAPGPDTRPGDGASASVDRPSDTAPAFAFDSEAARANFERVKPHAEAFLRARVLASIGL